MALDLSRLRRGELIAAAAAIVLLVDMFLGWYGPHQGSGGARTAWEAFSVIDVVLLLTCLAALGLALLTATQRTVALPVTAAVIATALGFLATVLVAFRVLIDQPGPDAAVDDTLWAWVGLLACIAIVYGGYRSMRDEGSAPTGAPKPAAGAPSSSEPPLSPAP